MSTSQSGPHGRRAVPLLNYDSSRPSKWCIEPAGRALLEDNVGCRLTILSIVGDSRRGKSTLLNRFLGKDVFPVSDGIAPCTNGVLVYVDDQPLPDGSRLVVLDTEGSSDVERRDPTFDAHLFAMMAMLSSSIVYFNDGVINRAALDRMNCVVQLGSLVDARREGGGRANSSALAQIYPALVFVCRNFHLELSPGIDTEDQYLESVLEQSMEMTPEQMSANVRRALITRNFVRRHCVCLPYPDQRAEFEAALARLRETLRGTLRPKVLTNTDANAPTTNLPLDGPLFFHHLQGVVDAFNAGHAVRVPSMWEATMRRACEAAFEQGKARFAEFMARQRQRIPMSEQEYQDFITQDCARESEEVRSEFVRRTVVDHEHQPRYLERLGDEIERERAEFAALDYEASAARCREVLDALMGELRARVEASGGFESLQAFRAAWEQGLARLRDTRPGRARVEELRRVQTEKAQLQRVLEQHLRVGELERQTEEMRNQREADALQNASQMQRAAEELNDTRTRLQQTMEALRQAQQQATERHAAAQTRLDALQRQHEEELRRASAEHNDAQARLQARLLQDVEEARREAARNAESAKAAHDKQLQELNERLGEARREVETLRVRADALAAQTGKKKGRGLFDLVLPVLGFVGKVFGLF